MNPLIASILGTHARIASGEPQATVAVKTVVPRKRVCCVCGGPANKLNESKCANYMCRADTVLAKE